MTVSVLTISGVFRSVSGLCRVVYCTEWCTVQSGVLYRVVTVQSVLYRVVTVQSVLYRVVYCTECTVQSGGLDSCVLYRVVTNT